MKLLWVKTDFLHPTNRGGQIRTLEMLKRLHARHEVHYVAFDDGNAEGLARAGEYAARSYPIEHRAPPRGSAKFAGQVMAGLFSREPVVINRYRSEGMRRQVEALSRAEKFDSIVCDFLFPSPNLPDLTGCVLFQHNVEAIIWSRYVETARTPAHRWFFELQAKRMREYEAQVCRAVKQVVAVSPVDAEIMRKQYGAKRVAAVSTGVDLDYFAPPAPGALADLVFVGSMDWMPNIDGIEYFLDEIFPLIRRKRPDCLLTIVGRRPPKSLEMRAANDPNVKVTGTVDDVRPYLWSAAASIVPLRVGGGTRLKIYESMAAKTPVVSTSIGAEGLDVHPPDDIRIADTAEAFADACLDLLADPAARDRMARAAWDLVFSHYSWERVTADFERLLFS